MALPTVGGSDGTWGTELNSFLDVSHESNGTLKEAEVIASSTARTCDIDGTPTVVYTKYLTGTMASSASTTVNHEVSSAIDKILHLFVMCYDGTNNVWLAPSNYNIASTQAYVVSMNATQVVLQSVGSDIQGQAYIIKIDYIL